MTDPTIKSCPCCGSHAILGISPPMPGGQGQMFDTIGIVCESCGLTVAEIGERGMQERERADIVVGKWNARVAV